MNEVHKDPGIYPAIPLQVEISRATVLERPILRHLMELYQYDFSEFDGAEVGPKYKIMRNLFTAFVQPCTEKEHI